jgi:DNA (cytosine-5)-methyltransferase 1
MSAYYNEIDPYAAQWLRNLIAAGHIAPGDVDERSIEDVQPDDVRGYTHCHFFAGIGGWSYALRLSGWPDDRPVWTGSCPCQGYSAAGKSEGAADARNLWPRWFRLIRECRPVRVFGEQVADAIGHGWLDDVSTGMEAEGYTIGAVVLGAHSVGAPHKRQRLWFVADTSSHGLEEQRLSAEGRQVVADAGRGRRMCADAVVADTDGESSLWPAIARQESHPWRVEPALGRVAHGVSHKLVEPALRGYGNAIVPQVAAEFIGAYLDAVTERE